MSGIFHDLRYALRQLRKSPGFTLVAVLTLAIGMGATAAIFSVVDSLLLRPLPYPNSPRVVRVWNTFAPRGMSEIPVSEPEFNEYQRSESFAHLAGFSSGAVTLTGSGEPLRISASWVTSGFFSVFGNQPLLGRTFSVDEYTSGPAQVAVLSFRLWQNRFAADPGVIGKSVTLDGRNCMVIGVMPGAFAVPSEETDLWQPLPIAPASSNLGNHYLNLAGDLKPGVTIDSATSGMAIILQQIQQKYPSYYRQAVGLGVRMVSLRDQMVGDVRPALLTLMTGVGFVLLIACTNVANLFLARGEIRKPEIAARVALGATHWRILRQELVQTLVVFLAGGILGLLIAYIATRTLSLQNNLGARLADQTGVDLRVFAFAAATCLLTGLIFGLMPALRASRSSFSGILKTAGRNLTGGRRLRVRSVLVSSEIALSLLLLIGAGLMISSLWRLLGVSLGFNPDAVATMRLALPEKDYSLTQTVSFYRELRRRIQGIPGVEEAAIVNQLPMNDATANASFEVEGRAGSGDINVADTNIISPGYFRAMQIPLLAGRPLSDEDAQAAAPGIVVNQTLVRKIWPGVDPIGKRIRVRSDAPWLPVVGVVGDIKNHGVNTATRPEIYFPYTDQPIGLWADFRTVTLVVRAAARPEQVAGAIRAQLHNLDPTLPIYNVVAFEQIVSSSVSATRFPTLVLSFFALLALTLGAIGLYGVVTYTVAQSRREIGIRMALGATRERVMRLFLREALIWTALGESAGLVAAFILVRYMRSLLFQVSPFDPKVFLLVAGILTVVALAAAALPARRAARVDPIVALRYE